MLKPRLEDPIIHYREDGDFCLFCDREIGDFSFLYNPNWQTPEWRAKLIAERDYKDGTKIGEHAPGCPTRRAAYYLGSEGG